LDDSIPHPLTSWIASNIAPIPGIDLWVCKGEHPILAYSLMRQFQGDEPGTRYDPGAICAIWEFVRHATAKDGFMLIAFEHETPVDFNPLKGVEILDVRKDAYTLALRKVLAVIYWSVGEMFAMIMGCGSLGSERGLLARHLVLSCCVRHILAMGWRPKQYLSMPNNFIGEFREVLYDELGVSLQPKKKQQHYPIDYERRENIDLGL
jgi:hypothetical protein